MQEPEDASSQNMPQKAGSLPGSLCAVVAGSGSFSGRACGKGSRARSCAFFEINWCVLVCSFTRRAIMAITVKASLSSPPSSPASESSYLSSSSLSSSSWTSSSSSSSSSAAAAAASSCNRLRRQHQQQHPHRRHRDIIIVVIGVVVVAVAIAIAIAACKKSIGVAFLCAVGPNCWPPAWLQARVLEPLISHFFWVQGVCFVFLKV